ncbi:diphthamide biosynthesis protein 2, putative [Plasmodium berghei]|uniref:Diphthamide biosynthesis protein 2, putative n=2 Tax=Plasmodium berghei TaxID=5821 RepID=A0A509AMS3_PLABA|nr:diphthamide biosynthesis protein 2, putative [Plasmodium berghei ANKA]CXI51490.1 diphthamide biosynthesis protein 2, putative [Plasmodium berghei]SCL94452.1 diphthamide biosynthesis protein 2, putative [Plasmodium berghei]SCM16026.1 diphthamide biosynthesis protein 2, putative [Plasmodium berghei]SCM17822.1 diphthamide biosynthesis protein 2, putative [Plasmodium berghei]SCN26086.1 diphthamide biosynthesis protein 2, putative [Plasmodium berghei]|eukprot:XP_034421951.1 diphthamide biosynthesis protein 2, putative [Plasmodium berghei ANKA]
MKLNAESISKKYELELLSHIILNYGFKNVAIQLADYMLNDSLFISNTIKNILLNSQNDRVSKDSNLRVGNKNGETGKDEKSEKNFEQKFEQNCCSGNCNKNKTICDISINKETNNIDQVNLYILGDTTLNECCEDYVCSDHVHADFLVHYGISCQSFITPYIPSINIFNKINIEGHFLKNINEFISKKNILEENKISIILTDVSYINYMKQLVICFCDKNKMSFLCDEKKQKIFYEIDNKIISSKNIYDQNILVSEKKEGNNSVNNTCTSSNSIIDDNTFTSSDLQFTNIIIGMHRIANNMNGNVYYGYWDAYVEFKIDDNIFDKYKFMCGRLLFKVFYNTKEKTFVYKIVKKKHIECKLENEEECTLNNKCANIYLFAGKEKDFTNRVILEYGSYYDIYSYNDVTIFSNENNKINKLLLKRYNLIEICKKVNTFGIIIGNVNLCKNKELRLLINYILRKNGKKCFTIVTNKLNSAKLENFYDIEMYILLTCSENSLLELKDFSKKIINPYEFFVAYNYLEWNCNYLFDFYDLLNAKEIKKEYISSLRKDKYFTWDINSEQLCIKNENNNEQQELLLKKYDHLIDHNSTISVQDQQKFITRFQENSSMCQYFMETIKENEKREFKGVDINYNTEEIPIAVQGLDGIAQRYDSDLKFSK